MAKNKRLRRPSVEESGATRVRNPVARKEALGVIFSVSAVIGFISLISFHPDDPVFKSLGNRPHNMAGLVGAYLAKWMLSGMGLCAFLVPVLIAWAALVAFGLKLVRPTLKNTFGTLAFIPQAAVMSYLAAGGRTVLGHPAGGAMGEALAGLLLSLFSFAGTVVMVSGGLVLSLVAIFGVSPSRAVFWSGSVLWKLLLIVAEKLVLVGRKFMNFSLVAAKKLTMRLAEEARELYVNLRHPTEDDGNGPVVSLRSLEPALSPAGASSCVGSFIEPCEMCSMPTVSIPSEPVIITQPQSNVDEEPQVEEKPPEESKADEPKPSSRSLKRRQEPEIVIPKLDPPTPLVENKTEKKAIDFSAFQLPSLDMLQMQPQEETEIEKAELQQYARRLEEKLATYGVEGQVIKIMPGPVVTMYEYVPADGIKVSKIAGLSNDLALALGATSVRIVAPIPGRSVVGIEVANGKRQTVYAKEIIAHQVFQRSKSKLTLALGKNIEGAPYVTDLNQMPHLLVAGATGTGKSVALNAMIVSILYRATPQDVRFIMVDPKVLELSLYEGIPHLLLPVVTDPRKAQAALQWAVGEMERRIGLLHEAGVRNLDAYNKKIEKARNGEKPSTSPVDEQLEKKVIVIDRTAETESLPPPETAPKDEPDLSQRDKLPHIVIVIDELADLMMTSGREVETAIARIAQKARAAGIHLIVATQRPSVNVITGLIKANLPARISFRVASKVDSRTILDANGAETLLGNGDMLFHPPTSADLIRIHGALITEEEITRVVEHLKRQAQPVYDESILAAANTEENKEGNVEEDDVDDELYDKAVALVAEIGQASTSLIQRKLRIGYNRAARIIERMEREGVVGPADGVKPRPVLINNITP